MNVSSVEFIIFVVALIANISILVTVFRYSTKNESRMLFSIFILAQLFWISINYLSFQTLTHPNFLLITKLTLFFGVLHSIAFFLFINNFLTTTSFKEKRSQIWILCTGIFIAALTFSPAFFNDLTTDINGTPSPKTGPLISLFGLFVGYCIISSFYTIFKRYKLSSGEEKSQWRFLSVGLIATFILVIAFSFLNFIVFRNASTVRFGHLYTLPFVTFSAYAMIKHKLLNIKAVLAEIMAIVLNSIIFIQLINSQSTVQFVISVLVFLGTLLVGILLIKGVEKEVKQREQLQVLTAQLEDANEKLKALDLARAEFISIASHQLRTPPATIKWYMSSILSGDYGKIPKEAFTQLEKVQTTNNGLISLIEDILNVSRIERGKMEFMFQEIELSEIAKQAYEQLIPIAKEKGLKYSFKKPKKTLPKIMADREKLKQVMNNIIDNSIKYTPKGSVEVSLSATLTDIVFEVKDTGKGFSKEEESQIFQKFSRGKESLKHSAGLGLGLYVAKIIIEQHKGKLLAQSAGEGKGSKFSFTIPIKSGLKTTTLVELGK